MPESYPNAEPDTNGSQSGGATSGSDEESDSDVDSGAYEAEEAKLTAPKHRQLEDNNMGPESANVTAMYPLTLYCANIIGHLLLETRKTLKVSFTPRNHREAMASSQDSEWQASMER